ncbi:MAG: adenylate/guanylate cyclase domain-containing protein [bacterium]
MKLFTRRFRENMILTLVASAVMSACFVSGVAYFLDARFSDLLFLQRTPRPEIAIIAIDDKSIQGIGQWPWKRALHTEIITKLHEAGARVIGYDVNFPEASSAGAADDAVLQKALIGANVVLPVELTLEKINGEWVGSNPLYPIASFQKSAATGSVNIPRDGDGIARSMPLYISKKEAQTAFAEMIFALQSTELRTVPKGNEVVRVNFAGPPGNFPRYSAVDLLNDKIAVEKLRGKIVLVGATASDLHDDMMVPTSRGIPMSGIEIHANVLDTLLSRNELQTLPKPYGVALILIYALIIGVLVTRYKLRFGTIAVPILAVVHVLIAIIAFGSNLILPIVWPEMAIFATYVLVVATRYFHEKREREKLRATLDQYLSPKVVSDLLANPDKLKLGGERRSMTVLFSDLRGFTTLSEGLKPEMLVTVLNAYLDTMTEKVFATNGVVDKYMGDAIMAFWGASFLDPDHTDRAIQTAILMRSTLNEMNASKSWPNGVQLNLGIGVNSGDMVVGNMGSSKRFDYTVMGDAVNLGSRIEGLNKEYGTQIIVSEFAKRLATPGKFIYRTLDLVAVKGKKEPVEIFEVVGVSSSAMGTVPKAAGDCPLAEFEQAIELYRVQEFEEAKLIFVKLAESGDAASKLYIGRCEEFMAHPPEPGWNGVWVYTKK